MNKKHKHIWMFLGGSASSSVPIGSASWRCTICEIEKRVPGMYTNPDGYTLTAKELYDSLDDYTQMSLEDCRKEIKREKRLMKDMKRCKE